MNKNDNLKWAFRRLCEMTNQPYILDHIACYGGYVIELPCESGGVSHPFSCVRRPRKEMLSFIRGIICGLEILENYKRGLL